MPTDLLEELDIEESNGSMILLLGQTGAGKSHFINRLKPGSVKESAHSVSCTAKPQLVEIEVDGQLFLLVDTPGFNDTWRDFERSDSVILEEIARTLALQTQLGVKLRGILYLYDILSPRMTGDTLRQTEMIKKVCGPANYSNVTLVTSRWPESLEMQKSFGCPIREGDLRRLFWGDMIKGGSKMWRFDDTTQGARSILRTFKNKKDIVLALQGEMAVGKILGSTSAGAHIVTERKKDEQRVSELASVAEGERNEGQAVEMDNLKQSIGKRVADEEILNENVFDKVRDDIRMAAEELKKERKTRTVQNIISWLFQIGSITANVVAAALG